MTLLDGLAVTRFISPEVLTGLLTGQYKLYGGVIRWASGTEHGGQIVQHLLPVGKTVVGNVLDILAPFNPVLSAIDDFRLTQNLNALGSQMASLEVATERIFQVATGTMVVSGLNLAVSAVGFAVIGHRLNQLHSKLNELQKDVKVIRHLLELDERTRLESAIKDLRHGTETTNADSRSALLMNARNILGPISLKYRALLSSKEASLEEVLVSEEYYFLTALAHARCSAELHMPDVAAKEIAEVEAFWQAEARHIARRHLLGDSPERFLASDFSQMVKLDVLIIWLDFAYAEERGVHWLDVLRQRTTPWYARSWRDTLPKRLASGGIKREESRILPTLQKLTAKNNLLSGYVEQYKLFEKHDVTPSVFQARITEIARENNLTEYAVLSA